MSSIFPPATEESPPHVPAGPWKRLFARSIDIWLGAAVTMALGSLLSTGAPWSTLASWYHTRSGLLTLALALTVAPFVVESVMHAVFGNTLGKYLFGMRVIETATGDPPSFVRYARRAMSVWVSGMFMGAFGGLVAGAALALSGTALLAASGERAGPGMLLVITGTVLAWALPIVAMRRQHRRVAQGMQASYDEHGGFDVVETTVTVPRLALGAAILILQVFLIGKNLTQARQPVIVAADAPPVRSSPVQEPAAPPPPADQWRNPVSGLAARLGEHWRFVPGGSAAGFGNLRFTTPDGRSEVALESVHRDSRDLEEFAQAHTDRLANSVRFENPGRIFSLPEGSVWQNEGTGTDDPSSLVFVQILASPTRYWIVTSRRRADDARAETLGEDLRGRLWSTLR